MTDVPAATEADVGIRQVADSLSESEEKLRQLVENIDEVLWMTDPVKNQMLYISPAYEKIWKRTTASLRASPQEWMEAIHPDDRERVIVAAQKQATELYDVEYRIVQPGGAERTISDRAFPIKNDQGQVYRIVGIAKDITERKRMEEVLKVQREEQQIIFDSVPAWIFFKDKENRFIRVNSAFAAAMGKPKEQLEGKSLFDMYPKEQAEAFWKDDQEVMAAGKPKLGIIESVKSDDGTLWLQTDKVPYRDAHDAIVGIIGISVNISAQKRLQEELKRSNEELELANKLMVGRELAMIELKKKFKALEDRLTAAGLPPEGERHA